MPWEKGTSLPCGLKGRESSEVSTKPPLALC